VVRLKAAERAKIRNYFIIVGDHGFVDIHSALSPNMAKKEAGFIARKRDTLESKISYFRRICFFNVKR
jgi:hypothetical protein